MNYKLLNRITAGVVFVISFLVLLSTVQPSVSFWDCGEFAAAAYSVQVPHPPGAPFFGILGRIFAMLPIASDTALRINIISVLASAFSVLFLYLIAVKLIENFKGKEYKSTFDAAVTYLAAAIGALSFSFSDTFWFNGVEAEVYASSTFLLAAITYLMVRWNEKADDPDSEKYILGIAYLIGLSTGTHLMSVLAIVSVAMIIIFRKYVTDYETLKVSGYYFLAHVAVVLIAAFLLWGEQTGTTPPSPEEYGAFDSKFKIVMVVISIIFCGIFWKKLFNKNSIYLPLLIGGIALAVTYPGVVKVLPGIISSIAGADSTMAAVVFVVILAILGYAVYYSIKNDKATMHLVFMSLIFILLGFTTYTMTIVRANQNPPMNENQPDDFPELVSYLNREQYGDFPIFKRRFATEPHQQGVYSNYSSDLDFWWKYQMNHMTTRYFLWNYAGRQGWNQDDGANIAPFNGVGNLFGKIFNVHFEGEWKDSLLGIPFLLGLLGIYFHFRRDWKMASIFMVLFIFMGYLTAFYQNQQEPQPRERDYFYVGAFFVFSIWIGIAVQAIADVIRYKAKGSMQRGFTVAFLAAAIFFVPVKMVWANYFTHDRSSNYVPFDYSYNLLQSCAPNAVLFTNGDNDTFPLWYLQDVAGIRRDVKIVNLSLLNTNWYIRQLKNNDPYKVGTVKMGYTNEQIDELRPIQWEPQNVTIPAPNTGAAASEMFKRYNISDSSVIKQGGITFRMNNTLTFGNVKAVRVQDLMVKDIVQSNNWERPIFFAVTCSEDSKIGLSDYLRMEGMAFRLVPEKRTGSDFIEPNIMKQQIFGSDTEISKEYKPGFLFRGLDNPKIFFDENHLRMTQNYRNTFIRLALYYINHQQNSYAVQTLDLMQKKLPPSVIPAEAGLRFEIANLYSGAGATDKANVMYKDVEKEMLVALEKNPSDINSYYNPYRILLGIYENQKAYAKLADLWGKIQVIYPNDPNVKANIEKYRSLAKGDKVVVDSVPKPDTTSKK